MEPNTAKPALHINHILHIHLQPLRLLDGIQIQDMRDLSQCGCVQAFAEGASQGAAYDLGTHHCNAHS